MDKLTAQKIKNLLAKKHSDDLFITECKTGRSGSSILDAWAMKKSWTTPLHWGYEIKVSRSDFLQDNKWKSYLDYCNQFYFVCPYDLIQKEELPKEVGLMWVSSTGTRLYTKKKAPTREVDIKESVYRYILMNRIKTCESTFGTPLRKRDPKKYWKAWLADKKLNQDFGRMVGKKIWEFVKDNVKDVERENSRLKTQNQYLQQFRELEKDMNKMGLSASDIRKMMTSGIEEAIGNKLKNLRYGLHHTKIDVESSIKRLDNFLETHTQDS